MVGGDLPAMLRRLAAGRIMTDDGCEGTSRDKGPSQGHTGSDEERDEVSGEVR